MYFGVPVTGTPTERSDGQRGIRLVRTTRMCRSAKSGYTCGALAIKSTSVSWADVSHLLLLLQQPVRLLQFCSVVIVSPQHCTTLSFRALLPSLFTAVPASEWVVAFIRQMSACQPYRLCCTDIMTPLRQRQKRNWNTQASCQSACCKWQTVTAAVQTEPNRRIQLHEVLLKTVRVSSTVKFVCLHLMQSVR